MDKLPDEVLLMIFELLPSRDMLSGVARVCRRWAALATRRALEVRHPDQLQRLHRGIISLQVSTRLESLGSFLATTTEVTPRIRNLTVRAANPFGNETLAALARLHHLDHLDVFMQTRIVDERVLPVLLRLSSVVINETLQPGVLQALSKSKRLRALHMYGRSMYYMPRDLMSLLRSRRYHLRELTLRCAELTDRDYFHIGNCSGLTSLQLYSCWVMTYKGASLATRPSLLRRLHITGARMVRPRTLAHLIDELPPLIEELVLSATWFGPEHVLPLVTRLPALRLLELWRCRLESDSIISLASALPELRTLDCDVALSDRNICTLAQHPSLTDLRCLFKEKESQTKAQFRDIYTISNPCSERVLRVRAADAQFSGRFLRRGSCDEGHRAALFYFWTQEHELEPLPRDSRPGFDDDDDDYCP